MSFLFCKQSRGDIVVVSPPPVAVLLMDNLESSSKIPPSPSSGSVVHVYFEVPVAHVECLYLMF